MSDTQVSLGTRLRELRRAAELSQSELSDRSGIPKPTLSRYENDHVSPSLQTLERLAVALGVSESSILPVVTPLDAFVRALTEAGVTFATVEEAERAAADVAIQLNRPAAQAG